jgi:acyl-CoA synthetase (NDP forming)
MNDPVEFIRNLGRKALAEHEVKAILKHYGIRVPRYEVLEEYRPVDLRYPLAVKVSSPEVLHKTDVGGVILGVKNEEELKVAVEEIRGKFPGAAVLVEEMEKSGVEVIVGVLRDRDFGLAIMFGIGGIFTEVFRDVTFRVLPIDEDDAEDMLTEIKGRKVLEGFRGIKVDREGLKELLLRVSDMAMDLSDFIEQMDLNPVFVREDGAVVVDAKMVLR